METCGAALIEGWNVQPAGAARSECSASSSRPSIPKRPLVASLAALVPGAMDGLVSEVIVADGGSHDDTATVADVAGCNFTVIEGPLGRRLKTAATTARAPWLLFLRPGTVPDAAWTGEVRRFVERSPPDARAAVFRRGRAAQPALKEMLSLARGGARRAAASRARPAHRPSLLRRTRRPLRCRQPIPKPISSAASAAGAW